MTNWPLWKFVLGGLAVAIVGFIWGALMAGVPYQEPTIEQRASYAFHSNGAFGLMCVGGTLMLLGMAGYAFRRLRGPKSTGRQV